MMFIKIDKRTVKTLIVKSLYTAYKLKGYVKIV